MALAGNASMAQDQDGSGITGRIVCQYSLMLNHCCMKHESGMEVPHDFESLLTPWSEEVSFSFPQFNYSLNCSYCQLLTTLLSPQPNTIYYVDRVPKVASAPD